MSKVKAKILIGPVNKYNKGAVPMVNRAFISGLSDKYNFCPFNMKRKYGKTELSNLNLVNLLYFFKHYIIWIMTILIYKPDLVHYPITSYWNLEKSLLFLSTAKFLGVKKVVGHLHGGAFDLFWQKLNPLRKKISLKLFSKLNSIIVASYYWKDFFENNGIKITVNIVNNPIDRDFEMRMSELHSGNNNEKILFVGSLGKRKGVYDIIEVCKSINRQFTITAVGSEERKNDLYKIRNLTKEFKLSPKIRIIKSEKMKLEDKVNFFGNSGIFLFPSHNENFPLVIIEAACSGLAIITTRVGALPEFFEHNKSVIFVEPGNIKQIKEAVIDLLENPEKRKRLGKEARKVFLEKLSRKKIMESLNNVYQSVLREN